MSSARLDLKEVTVRYGDTVAVDRLTATFEAGAIHGLLGRNGSGKTSLLSVIAAFRRATGGQVLHDAEPVFENPAAVARTCFIRGAGDTVANDWPSDRVGDALTFAASLRPRWDPDHAERLVERFGLRRDARLSELSRGQRSAVGVVLGLASRAPLTIFDETYLGMDAPSRYAFYDELLADHLEHPRTFVLSTHLIEEVASLFSTVTIIDRGRLLVQADADELRARGAAVTGPVEAVVGFTRGRTVLATKQLGPTRSDTVYGELDEADHRRARELGLSLDPVPIQDLFVHLTDPAGHAAADTDVHGRSLR